MLNYPLDAEQGEWWARGFLPNDLHDTASPSKNGCGPLVPRGWLPLMCMCKLSLGSKIFFFPLRQTCCLTQSKTGQYFINCHHLLRCWRKKGKSQALRKTSPWSPHTYVHVPPLHQPFLKTRLDFSCFSISCVSNSNSLLPVPLAKGCLQFIPDSSFMGGCFDTEQRKLWTVIRLLGLLLLEGLPHWDCYSFKEKYFHDFERQMLWASNLT